MLLQAKNYVGTGNWLDEANSHDAVPQNSPTFTRAGPDSYFTLDGINQHFRVADHANLDNANVDMTIMVVATAAADPADWSRAMAKSDGTNLWQFGYNNASPPVPYSNVDDNVNDVFVIYQTAITLGAKHVFALTIDADGACNLHMDGVTGTGPDGTVVGDVSNASALTIGGLLASDFAAIDVYAAVLWRELLSAADITLAGAELTEGGSSLMMMGVG